MANSTKTKSAIKAELLRMEEDCIHSGKAHFNAAFRWTQWHYFFGIPSVVLATAAGAAFFRDFPVFAGAMSSIVAILTALMTFLKPSERAASHKNSGDQYLALRNDSRVFREVELERLSDDESAFNSMASLTTRRNELNAASSAIANKDYKKARAGIDAGEATHLVDKKSQ